MSQGVITPVALAPVTKNVVTSFAMKEDAASSGYSGSSPASFGRYAHSHNFFLAFFLLPILDPRVYPRSKMRLQGASWRQCKEVAFVDVSGFESRTQSIRRRRPTPPLPPNLSMLYNLWCLLRVTSSTVVSYSNENFSFKCELPACFFLSTKKGGQQREDGCKIGHSHLNEKLSFEQDATVGQ